MVYESKVVPNYNKIHRVLIFLTVLVFIIISSNNSVFAQYLHNKSLEEITKQTSELNKTAYIDVNKNPRDIGVSFSGTYEIDKAYVANSGSNSISIISADNNTKVRKDIPVEDNPTAIGINKFTNTVYVANSGSDSISVINDTTNKFINNIPVGNNPTAIGIPSSTMEEIGIPRFLLQSSQVFNFFSNTVYVANLFSDNVSVINGITNKFIKNIPVGDAPVDINFNFLVGIIYVANSGSDSISVINGITNKFIKNIPVGNNPTAIGINKFTNTVYVANTLSDNVSVIDGITNKFINNIPVGDNPTAIGINEFTGTVYVANTSSDNVSVINGTTNKFIKNIPVGDAPRDIISFGQPVYINTVYVANSGSDSISVIDGITNKFIKNIPVGDNPTAIGINEFTGTVYVANSDSNSISVIDIITNKVVAGIKLQLYPFNSGFIECNGLIPPTSQHFYVYSGSTCIAKPNKGFEFLSWEENLQNNSTQIINFSQPASALDSIKDFFNIKSEEPEAKLKITNFGSFTANFKELPAPLPPEYWATLFGVIVTAFISSWLTPTIIGWRKAKRHQNRLNDYQNELKDLYKDNKLDKHDIDKLDRLRDKIIFSYTKGDINKEQYDVLIKHLSIQYNEIFKNEIDSLKIKKDIGKKVKLKNELYSDLDDSYLNEKIDKEHYDLLKEKLSEL